MKYCKPFVTDKKWLGWEVSRGVVGSECVDLLGETINTKMDNAKILLQASKEIGLEINIDTAK
jgi:hypothetical protein